MTTVVVIQARTNSSRLPGKVLLPICGLPVVVLAAKRAGNTGRKVIVATSTEKSDDGLAQIVLQHGIECFRGSLENTLLRFVNALSTYDESTIVFRLTADNVIPDGPLLDEIEHEFLDRGLEYIACNGMNSGLPYGMSAEVTRLRHLREALQSDPSAPDTEHVTPYIVRKFGGNYFEKYLSHKMGHYRCTIDCLDDYLGVTKLFDHVKNPVDERSLALIGRLKGADLQPSVTRPASKMVLGTAQVGLSYGIANTRGQPSREDARMIIKTAIANGVQYLDTARAYGDSEEVIKDALSAGWQGRTKVITKLAPLDECPKDADSATVNSFVDASLYQSMSALGVQQIDTLLLHRVAYLKAWNGKAWRRLLEHRERGRIQVLGASVQTPEELMAAMDNTDVAHIQLPINILDWRWQEISKEIQQTKANRVLTIHARSLLLQGLLGSKERALWARSHVVKPEPVWRWLDDTCKKFKRSSIADLCISYVMGLCWVDGIVVGVETLEQLSENLAIVAKNSLTAAQVTFITDTRPKLEARSLNPALWKAGCL